ncbi:MAG: glycosyltransferase family 2 protein [bacterium]|nr:glycosyltransferase family 2 protein [bacterium]
MSACIGIVICNYNKEDYIVNCIKSILASTMKDFDIYVVDNASADHSVERIKEVYAGQVTLIVNQENLGGSGGFNTGLREALKHDYQYLMCVDNDVVFDERAVEELYQFLEHHPETGMVGSKVYFMDDPKKIWSYGGEINYERYVQVDHYRNCIDTADIPEMDYVDYVPACALMARTEAIRKVGIMPEDNFIYLDDMEWGYNFNQAGYKVAVCGTSRVWHKGGGRNAGNTFIHYYMWRNRLNFFMKELPKEEKEQFTENILTEMFRMIYSVNLKGETNIIKTLMYAFDDAVHHVRGKAIEGKILTRVSVANRLELALKNSNSVIILFNGNYEGMGNIIRNIRGFHEDMKIAIAIDDTFDREQYPDCEITGEYHPEEYDAHLVMCSHIFSLPEDAPEDWYIDPWCNIIYSAEDFVYCKSFEQTKDLFVLCKKELLLQIE